MGYIDEVVAQRGEDNVNYIIYIICLYILVQYEFSLGYINYLDCYKFEAENVVFRTLQISYVDKVVQRA